MTTLQKTRRLARASSPYFFALLLAMGAGCSRSASAPAVLSVAQLAPALEKAFHNAKPQTRDLADKIIASLKAADYLHAYTELHSLESQPGLTRAQDNTLASELFTVNELLQSEQSQGNQQAARALQHYRAAK